MFLTFRYDKKNMKLYGEVVVQEVLPALRSLVTKELLQGHKMNQTEVSAKLGITQPAVSQYKKALRGSNVKKLEASREVTSLVKKLSKEIATGAANPENVQLKFLEISHKIVDKELIEVETHMHSQSVPCHVCFS